MKIICYKLLFALVNLCFARTRQMRSAVDPHLSQETRAVGRKGKLDGIACRVVMSQIVNFTLIIRRHANPKLVGGPSRLSIAMSRYSVCICRAAGFDGYAHAASQKPTAGVAEHIDHVVILVDGLLSIAADAAQRHDTLVGNAGSAFSNDSRVFCGLSRKCSRIECEAHGQRHDGSNDPFHRMFHVLSSLYCVQSYQ